jgi:hypothetical protein
VIADRVGDCYRRLSTQTTIPPIHNFFYLIMKKDIIIGDVVYLTGGMFIGEYALVIGRTRRMIELRIISTNCTTRVMAYNVTKVENKVKLPTNHNDDYGNLDVYQKINAEINAIHKSMATIELLLRDLHF